MKLKLNLVLLCLLLVWTASGQKHTTRIYGYVVDENNRGVEHASVSLENTGIHTTTNSNGYYDLICAIKDSVKISFSHIGYEPIRHTIPQGKQVIQITVTLPLKTKELSAVNVTVNRRGTSNMETIAAEKYKMIPNASGSFESLLINFAGVSSNNELSSQYNVRGGSFDENIVYVNGTEIYRPLLIRAGQQEGLSFINPDMVGSVAFSSGGFNAEYGDKMASVLDVKYKTPTKFEASGMISLLGASAYAATTGKNFSQMHGIRYKTSKYLLGTLDTKGSYKPNFVDYQTLLNYKVSPKLEINFLGNFSRNDYTFIPEDRETRFGTFNMAEKLKVYYEGQEKDLFQTLFGAFSVNFKPKENLKLGLTASAFNSNENETFDITGEYVLGELKLGDSGEVEDGEQLGVGVYHEHARNRLKATVANFSHSGEWIKSGHSLKWGVNIQRELISDKIVEWEWRDSAGYSMPNKPNSLELFYNMKSNQQLQSWRSSAYLQDTYRLNTDAALFAITGGVRASYWDYNNEFLLSPRVSISALPHWDKDFSFRFSTGLYYQSPFYKELRDTISDALGNISIQLNPNLKSQRSVHFVLGGDHYFRLWGRPFKFTTETYLKLADRVTSYYVDNVRVRYSGKNDAVAYTAGLDFKLFGELVPGTDSWINLSLMRSREDIIDDFYTDKAGNKVFPGWISRPNEARYSMSMLLSDYLPNNPKYKMHLKAIYSDGLPVGPPRSPRYMGDRFRLRDYKRVDIGASRVLAGGSDKVMSSRWMKNFTNIWINFEVFNLFDFKNENSIYWVSDIYGNQHGSPNYLTGRQFNLKLMLDIK